MFLMLIFKFILTAEAEYRAYELAIVNPTSGSETKIISTLDHLQYRGFYQVPAGSEVIYLDSWRCWGNTKDFKPICPKPTPQATDERAPAATTP